MNKYLKETKLLDYNNKNIQELIKKRNWKFLDDYQKIEKIYNFVRDEINFGYNVSDDIPASKILFEGYGQCNTKGILFMALLRGVNIPCRIHGFTINKKLQRGAMTGIVYKLAPKDVIHSWVEVLYEGKWYELEGFILDKQYLNKLQKKFSNCKNDFCGYGVATKNFKNPPINWNKNNTYIQKEGINKDFGIYSDPDVFFKNHHQRISHLKEFMYKNIGRHVMNKNVIKIRNSK